MPFGCKKSVAKGGANGSGGKKAEKEKGNAAEKGNGNAAVPEVASGTGRVSGNVAGGSRASGSGKVSGGKKKPGNVSGGGKVPENVIGIGKISGNSGREFGGASETESDLSGSVRGSIRGSRLVWESAELSSGSRYVGEEFVPEDALAANGFLRQVPPSECEGEPGWAPSRSGTDGENLPPVQVHFTLNFTVEAMDTVDMTGVLTGPTEPATSVPHNYAMLAPFRGIVYKFKCHKELLMEASPFLKRLLETRPANYFVIVGADPRDIAVILDTVYRNGRAATNLAQLPTLLNLTWALEMEEMMMHVCDNFATIVDARLALVMYQYTQCRPDGYANKHILNLLGNNFRDASTEKLFLKLAFRDLEDILSWIVPGTVNAQVFLDAFLRWVHHDEENRYEYFYRLYATLPWQALSISRTQRSISLSGVSAFLGSYVKQALEDDWYRMGKDGTRPADRMVGHEIDPTGPVDAGRGYPVERLILYHTFLKDPRERFLIGYSKSLGCPDGPWINVNNQMTFKQRSESHAIHTISIKFANVGGRLFAYILDCELNYFRLYDDYLASWNDLPKPENICEHFHIAGSGNSTVYLYNGRQYRDPSTASKAELCYVQAWERGNKQRIMKYNAEASSWQVVPCQLEHRAFACMTANESYIFIFGGTTAAVGSNTPVSSVLMYDTRESTWRKMKDMKRKRMKAAACFHENKLYVTGGVKERSAEVYDFSTQRWRLLPTPISERSCHSLIPYEGKIFAIGGNGGTLKESVECYDTRAKRWTTIDAKIPIPDWTNREEFPDSHIAAGIFY